MKAFRKVILFALSLFTILTTCTQPEATPVPTQTPIPPTATSTATPTITPTFTPSPTPTPTFTPTPAVLDPSQIFAQVSPAVAFVDTPGGSGSGILIEGNYILTNAHVVWPFETVRLVFPDETEIIDAPVTNVDLMADLAVIGPIETEMESVTLADGEDRVIGSNVYLIGYPGEVEEFPQPTITRGLISRLREWEALGMTYFQSDATIAGGQSGGVLVAENGDIIGISGFNFSEAGFALVASAADIWPRTQALIQGEDVSGLGEWRLPTGESRKSSSVILENEWDGAVFVINEPAGTKIQLELDGDTANATIVMTDIYGYSLIDSSAEGTPVNTTTTELDAPYFVQIYQNLPDRNVFHLNSNSDFIRFDDEDDGRSLTMGRPYNGNLNYPGDIDYFVVTLNAGDRINIKADSILIDPYIWIHPRGFELTDHLVSDDDSGGGVFGLNAEMTYETPHTGLYFIAVGSSYGAETGGYILTLDSPYSGAPTPIAPTATPSPIESEVGLMKVYEDPNYNFSFEYPADWLKVLDNNPNAQFCQQAGADACFSSQDYASLILVVIEDLSSLGMDGLTIDDYIDLILESNAGPNVKVISQESIETRSGLTPTIFKSEVADLLRADRMIYYRDGLWYNITYLTFSEQYEDLEPIIEYSFETFQVE